MGDSGWRSAVDPRRLTLLEWALGSFHAAGLLVVAVLVLHLDDGLAGTLSAGGTALGAALYLALLATTVLTMRAILGPSGLAEWRGVVGTVRTIGWGALGGVLNGLALLAVLGAGLAVFFLLAHPGELADLPLVLTFGVLVAAVAGVVLGVAFAVVDIVILRAMDAMVPGGPPRADAAERRP